MPPIVSIVSVIALLFQRLDPPKLVSYVGDEVAVRAIDQEGRPIGGVTVEVKAPDQRLDRRVTDASGRILYVPQLPGRYEFAMNVPSGPRVISVYEVVTAPTRWLYAVVLTPLGLVLLWWNVRRLSRPVTATR